jgi:hypothetical protein
MWLAIALILLLLWVGGFLLFHVAFFFLRFLIILAVVALVLHFLSRGRRTL